ncbi:MAG TPA: methyltransferase MtaB domain-containing protein, partial [Bacteroidota bacterium]|nr:methyltransferase MtaB domain-containing protein [Bacteroidota bacterium]
MDDAMILYDTLLIPDSSDFSFGRAPRPVECGYGLIVGGGKVYPELNFTLPPMTIESGSWGTVMSEYREIAQMIRRASARLRLPGLMVEF